MAFKDYLHTYQNKKRACGGEIAAHFEYNDEDDDQTNTYGVDMV